PRGIVIDGKPGLGKSRLAEWMCQRAHEVGACTVLRAHHDQHGGPTTGLRGMVERWLRTDGLDRETVWDIVQSKILTLARHDEGLGANRFVEDEARALTEFLRPSDEQPGDAGGPAYQFDSKAEQLFVLRRVFRRLANRRPLLVWLDDVQWGDFALAFAEHA
ncbi:MAG: AAA family ATPase, partial [Bradymonadaceae bacterium]